MEYLVIIGIAVMFLLIISFLVAFNLSQRKKFQFRQQVQQMQQRQQNQLIEAAVRSEEGERHRIAEQLHDEVGAILSAAKLYLGNVNAENLRREDQQLYDKTLELLDESIIKVRTISHNLHSAILKELGLNEAIKNFIQKISSGTTMQTKVELDDNYPTSNAENDMSIYRIIQELCNNILKHSHATSLSIVSAVAGNAVNFTIEHNGNGLNQEQFEKLRYASQGLGLKNIQNRIILLRGNINFESVPGHHSTHLSIPLKS